MEPDDNDEHDVDIGVDDEDKTVVGTDMGGNECIKFILNKLKFKKKIKLSEKSVFFSFLS